jgi:small-conductance mechanosensitive channel
MLRHEYGQWAGPARNAGTMKREERIILIGLLVLATMAAIGLLLTRPVAPQANRSRSAGRTVIRKRDLVDERPLETARAMSSLAYTREEHRLARRALDVADNIVDAAFATALREAELHPAPQTKETRASQQQLVQAQASLTSDQQTIERLEQALQKKHGPDLDQQLELAKAQLALDQEQFVDAKQDLIRAGGDIQATLKRMLDEHVATHNTSITLPSGEPFGETWTLISHFRAWRALRDKRHQLADAARESESAVTELTRKHDELQQQIQQARFSANPHTSQTPEAAVHNPDAVAAVLHLSESTKTLVDYGKRIQDGRELSDIYHEWEAFAALRQRSSLHGMMQCVFCILLICLGGLTGTHYMGRLSRKLAPEKKRLHSLQLVARFAVQAIMLLLILLVILGAPGQTTTIIGLAGAGLTVALKDFIVAFFGWFVLMGKNGIRVGDWVEINGIGGEVVEIGILRTMLLETGQWSDAGHPTGRKVAFVNSFAVEGHYFNFSTTGQWLWDQLEVLVPQGIDPYAVIKAIQEIVIRETSADAKMAEQEWQTVAGSHALQSFSATPAINLKPSSQGVDVIVRYITRAHERYDLRGRLYTLIVELLHTSSQQLPTLISEANSAGSA